jgi:hypothetical protein
LAPDDALVVPRAINDHDDSTQEQSMATTTDIPDGLTSKQRRDLVVEERQRIRKEENDVYEEKVRLGDIRQLDVRREALLAHPFDPRTETSADARKITKTLWMISVLLPVVLGILAAIVMAVNR